MGDVSAIAACDAEIEAWVRSVAGDGVAVALVEPSALCAERAATTPRVEISLIDVQPSPGSDLPGRPKLRIALRYVVTIRADDVRSGHDILSQLMFAAMAEEKRDVVRGADCLAFWRAMGAPPRPSFFIEAYAEQAKIAARRSPPPVKGLRVVDFVLAAPGSTFRGAVVRKGSDGKTESLAGAVVLCTEPNTRCITNAEGFFDLGELPPWPLRKRIEVHAENSVWQFDVDVTRARDTSPAKPLLLEIEVG